MVVALVACRHEAATSPPKPHSVDAPAGSSAEMAPAQDAEAQPPMDRTLARCLEITEDGFDAEGKIKRDEGHDAVHDCCGQLAVAYSDLLERPDLYPGQTIDDWTTRDRCCHTTPFQDGSPACATPL